MIPVDPLEGWRLFDVTQGMEAFRFPGNPGLEVRGPFNRVEGEVREYVYGSSSSRMGTLGTGSLRAGAIRVWC